MSKVDITTIQDYYGVVFPQEYLDFQQTNSGSSFNLMESGEVTDWQIRFSELDDQFITNNIQVVNDVNPDPKRIIPIAWSVSSGNNYLLDYRKHSACPVVLLMEHEEAMVREDAESETDTPEEAQQLMEENVRVIADSFASFLAKLRAYQAL
ncbi:SMI1/KNR4 family protein [Paenibacillus sp. DCT19]|uniref:SMI1/KNR4 family protein n=1 Tax=Paenibacillus sp. DCT19 TaxID=2211212 RepID=UPI000FE23C5C|nr:SMI1/KNR4 family protein [Paenibacillus sp. DCT19]